MRKIISVFQRNYDTDRLIRDEVTPGAEWVLAGEGRATRKWDGTCCMIRDGKLYRRYELKRGKTAPAGFEPAQAPDEVTADVPGWLPVGDGPEDRWFREALDHHRVKAEPPDGTYECCGPRIGSRPPNPEGFDEHRLLPHGAENVPEFPRDFTGMRAWFERNRSIEGVVFWHDDGHGQSKGQGLRDQAGITAKTAKTPGLRASRRPRIDRRRAGDGWISPRNGDKQISLLPFSWAS